MESQKHVGETNNSRLCGQCWLSSGDPSCGCDGTEEEVGEYKEEQLDFFKESDT